MLFIRWRVRKLCMGAIIRSIGIQTPERILSNGDLETFLDTSNAWIQQRTGISTRRIAGDNETNLTMAVEAAKKAIEYVSPSSPIERIIVGTNTSRKIFPSVAMGVQAGLRKYFPLAIAVNASGYDIQSGCAGINEGLQQGDDAISSGRYRTVLVIGTDKLSDIADYRDRETCVLFGDGGVAYILEKGGADSGFVGHFSTGDGSGQPYLYADWGEKVALDEMLRAKAAGDSPRTHEGPIIHMNGKRVFAYVTRELASLIDGFEGNVSLNPHGIKFADLAAIIPHQANARMFENVGATYPEFLAKCKITINDFGNSSTASQGLPLRLFLENDAKFGDYILMVGFGAGLSFCANLYKVGPEIMGFAEKRQV
jgi:3-oxoacyl-[acyl-carrier-protein] synthase III